jgi:WD40-like Beta Propeller Repeat
MPRIACVTASILLAIVTLTSCVGIPLGHREVERILATTWTNDERLVVLAQLAEVGKTAWILSPEGSLVQEFEDYGDLVLMDETQTVRHKVRLRHYEQAIRAFALDQGAGFVILSMVGSQDHCCLVDNEGALSDCVAPEGYHFSPGESQFLPTSSELVSRRVHDSVARNDALNFRTGAIRTLDDSFRGLALNAHSTLEPERENRSPCAAENARLSPQEDLWVFACPESDKLELKTVLWVLQRDTPPIRVYEFPAITRDELAKRSYLAYKDRDPRHNLMSWPGDNEGIAWTADESAIYWCSSPQEHGVIVYMDGRDPIEKVPCLTHASWSPDGTRLAGLKDWKVVTWSIATRS